MSQIVVLLDIFSSASSNNSASLYSVDYMYSRVRALVLTFEQYRSIALSKRTSQTLNKLVPWHA